mmetsp:Transcript_11893/g.17679  ORF Transcript_11893/g.17679 Transcript_11893/m.17679 type:complete len:420 (+) Transcript_11893:79-1338(+)
MMQRILANGAKTIKKGSINIGKGQIRTPTRITTLCEGGLTREYRMTNQMKGFKGNPYEVLGVGKEASDSEIKKAFYVKAKKLHPDRSDDPNAKEKFADLNNAYSILKDKEKRKMYDMTGSAEAAEDAHHNPFGGMGGGNPFGGDAESFNDFFRGGGFEQFAQMFGGGGGFGMGGDPFGNRPTRGHDIMKQLSFSLKDSVYGTTQTVAVEKFTTCTSCDGTGNDPKSKPTTCTTCNGSGKITHHQGPMVFMGQCHSCDGTGMKQKPCSSCNGVGHKSRRTQVEVNIPAGITHGQSLRVTGYGGPGEMGGPQGDLILKVAVKPHPTWRRENLDLITTKTIDMIDAILGTEMSIENLKGEQVKVTIPPCSQHGDRVTLRGQGISTNRSSLKGNMVVRIKVKLPTKLNEEQKKLLEELREISN